ncbi:MAG TPA: hypothetical protein DCG75_01665 [Bacteroidales bacterium]|nr:hypothetical protein [Bacteroidales bacterium]
MKKFFLPLFILTMVIITVGIWLFQSGTAEPADSSKFPEIIQVIIIAALFSFGIYFAISRIKNQKQGLPVEDELSKKIKLKAAAYSYYVSLYLWLIAIYIIEEKSIEAHIVMTAGILGMAILFGAFYLYFSLRGNINE